MNYFWVAITPGITALILAGAGWLKAHTVGAKVDTHLAQVNASPKTLYSPPVK